MPKYLGLSEKEFCVLLTGKRLNELSVNIALAGPVGQAI